MYCVIMAGGVGMRFWPRSREKRSKQFLKIQNGQSLIQATVERFKSIVPPDNIVVVALQSQKKDLIRHLEEFPSRNFVLEPVARNTAPCIGLAALTLRRKDEESILVVTPSDHLISGAEPFRRAVQAAVELATEKECLVTLGIKPDRPSTAYGYIQINKNAGVYQGADSFSVKTFAEKPNLETARAFMQSGDFFWNSGIFVFKSRVYLDAVRRYLPDLYQALMDIDAAFGHEAYQDTMEKVYQKIRSISIDYGIMEKTENVLMIRADFDWSDLGSWEQLYKLSAKDENGNASQGHVTLLDSHNCYVSVQRGLVAVLGIDDVVMVQDGDVTLVCHRSKTEEVKQIVERLKKNGMQKYV